MKPEVKSRLIYLLLNSALLITLYYLVARIFPYIPAVYLAVGGGLALYYVIYNRGMTGKGVTPEMLPDTMTYAEKEAWIADRAQRAEKSRWVLLLLIPIILTLTIDTVVIYLIPLLMP